MNKNKVLLVDDEDINLDLLKNTLEDTYDIFIAKDAYTCIDVMKKVKPNIVLLDIVMPIKDGFQTMELIKKNLDIANIPVIFITALKDTINITKAFEMGAEDYITKPFNPLEVKTRVKTHIEKTMDKLEIKNLLVKTLGGSINMLMEILAISNPDAYAISNRIKQLVLELGKKVGMSELWRLELAGMLSLIGFHAIPVLTLEKILFGQKVSFEEKKIFDSYAENGAKIIEKIPRLEEVAKLVEGQNNFSGNVSLDYNNQFFMESIILNHSVQFELLRAKGIPSEVAINTMMKDKKYSERILNLIFSIIDSKKEAKIRDININILENGMVLGKDVRTKSGKVVLKKDMVINPIFREHILALFQLNEIDNPIWIKVKQY